MSRILFVFFVLIIMVSETIGGDEIRHVSPEMVNRIRSANRVEVFIFRGSESPAVASSNERLASDIFGLRSYTGFHVELVNRDLKQDIRDRFSELILDEKSYTVPVEPPPCDSFPTYGFVFIAEIDTTFVVVEDDCFQVVAFRTDGRSVGGGYAWTMGDEWRSVVEALGFDE